MSIVDFKCVLIQGRKKKDDEDGFVTDGSEGIGGKGSGGEGAGPPSKKRKTDGKSRKKAAGGEERGRKRERKGRGDTKAARKSGKKPLVEEKKGKFASKAIISSSDDSSEEGGKLRIASGSELFAFIYIFSLCNRVSEPSLNVFALLFFQWRRKRWRRNVWSATKNCFRKQWQRPFSISFTCNVFSFKGYFYIFVIFQLL